LQIAQDPVANTHINNNEWNASENTLIISVLFAANNPKNTINNSEYKVNCTQADHLLHCWAKPWLHNSKPQTHDNDEHASQTTLEARDHFGDNDSHLSCVACVINKELINNQTWSEFRNK